MNRKGGRGPQPGALIRGGNWNNGTNAGVFAVNGNNDAFARALGISVHTLRNWEQGRRMPEGPALALLRIVARHPRVLRENLALAG